MAEGLRSTFASWKSAKQDQNIRAHFDAIQQEKLRSNIELPDDQPVRNAELFEKWIEGAKDIEPDNTAAAKM